LKIEIKVLETDLAGQKERLLEQEANIVELEA
jgi:hypothetical protein